MYKKPNRPPHNILFVLQKPDICIMVSDSLHAYCFKTFLYDQMLLSNSFNGYVSWEIKDQIRAVS